MSHGADPVEKGTVQNTEGTPGGYAGKWLDIDLSSGKIDDIVFPDKMLEQYFGDRGMATKILWDRLGAKWVDLSAYDPENLLRFATGPMTGIDPGARTCVSGKSPASMEW